MNVKNLIHKLRGGLGELSPELSEKISRNDQMIDDRERPNQRRSS